MLFFLLEIFFFQHAAKFFSLVLFIHDWFSTKFYPTSETFSHFLWKAIVEDKLSFCLHQFEGFAFLINDLDYEFDANFWEICEICGEILLKFWYKWWIYLNTTENLKILLILPLALQNLIQNGVWFLRLWRVAKLRNLWNSWSFENKSR